jgi:predicted  nucleic acid-binding Zn-ribbon protein
MNRIMTVINFTGVIALGIVCVLQWGQIGRLQSDAVTAAREAEEQSAALSKEKEARGRAETDLAEVRDRLAASESAVESNRARAITAERSLASALATMEQYKTAVAKRDAVLGEQQAVVKRLATERNDAVAKYNELAKQAGG